MDRQRELYVEPYNLRSPPDTYREGEKTQKNDCYFHVWCAWRTVAAPITLPVAYVWLLYEVSIFGIYHLNNNQKYEG